MSKMRGNSESGGAKLSDVESNITCTLVGGTIEHPEVVKRWTGVSQDFFSRTVKKFIVKIEWGGWTRQFKNSRMFYRLNATKLKCTSNLIKSFSLSFFRVKQNVGVKS